MCIECAISYSREAIKTENGKKINRRSKLKTKYALSEEDFCLMLEAQDNSCACCKTEFDGLIKPNVDHDHETGLVRGILCYSCNRNVAAFDGPLRETYSAYVDQGGFL